MNKYNIVLEANYEDGEIAYRPIRKAHAENKLIITGLDNIVDNMKSERGLDVGDYESEEYNKLISKVISEFEEEADNNYEDYDLEISEGF